jgi:hypothetical protein
LRDVGTRREHAQTDGDQASLHFATTMMAARPKDGRVDSE